MENGVYFQKDGVCYALPIAPEQVTMTEENRIETVTVLGLGQICLPCSSELERYAMKFELTDNECHYAKETEISGSKLLVLLRNWRRNRTVVYLMISGPRYELRRNVVIRSMSVIQPGGPAGEYEVRLELMEYLDWREAWNRANTVQSDADAAAAGMEGQTQSADGTRLYTVLAGDSLWRIAKMQLGDGARWREIYALNSDKISNANLIYPGQNIRLPIT